MSKVDVYRLRNIGKGDGGSGSNFIEDYENGVKIKGHTIFNSLTENVQVETVVAEFDGDEQINYKVKSENGKRIIQPNYSWKKNGILFI